VLYGVLAFGLTVGVTAFVHILATGGSLEFAATILGILVGALVLTPLKLIAFRLPPRGARRQTLGLALHVFALLIAAGAVIVAIVGRGPWLGAAACLVGIALVLAGAGVVALQRRPADNPMKWHV
jgi:hypothetical protein